MLRKSTVIVKSRTHLISIKKNLSKAQILFCEVSLAKV